MKIQLQLWAATPFQPPLGGTDKNEEWAPLRITTHPHVGKLMLISKPHEKPQWNPLQTHGFPPQKNKFSPESWLFWTQSGQIWRYTESFRQVESLDVESWSFPEQGASISHPSH